MHAMMHETDLQATVRNFLSECRTATLATADDIGHPHAANIQYAGCAGFCELIWVSSPNSEHSRHLVARPRVALTVYAHEDAAQNIHGLQLHGHAQPIHEPPAINAAWDLYTQKYPFVITMPQVRELLDRGQQAFYRFSPTWLRWIDNRRSFGWKQEFNW